MSVQSEERPDAARIAAAFVESRRAGRGLAEYPGTIPETLAEAYQVQDRAIALDGDRIVGWKVGRIPDVLVARYGSNRLAGPILSRTVVPAADPLPAMPIFAEGFGAAEAEFLLRIAHAPEPGKTLFTLDEAAALIGDVHVGIEIASSPLAAINDLGPAVTVSDFGNNNGLVVGAAIADWRTADIARWPVSTLIDGQEIGTGRAETMPDGLLGAARFLIELLVARGYPIAPGLWISSGAITGVHPVRPGAHIEARFGTEHRVACTIGCAPTSS